MTRANRIVTTFGAAMAGAVVGYAVGVLSAPATGRDTRRRLGRKLEHQADDLMRKAEHSFEEAKHRLSDAVRG